MPSIGTLTEGTDWKWFTSFVERGGIAAQARLEKWEAKRVAPEWGEVKVFLQGLRHDRLHALEMAEVEAGCGLGDGRWKHALGELRPSDGDYAGIRDFSTPFALEYLFHGCLEEHGTLPSWRDVTRFIFEGHRSWYIEPFYARYKIVPGAPESKLGSPYMAALQWRVGNAYYSWLREVHLLTALRRKHDLDVRYHALADAEFKADLVHGDTVVALYVANDRYRDGAAGRKLTAAAANPGRKVVEARMELRKVFGKPWLVTDEGVADIAQAIRAA